MLDQGTLAAYEAGARAYAARGTSPDRERTAALRARALDGPVLDLGCGTGVHLGALGPGAIGVDPSGAMLAEARAAHPRVPLVRAAAGALPVRPRALGACWSSKALQHLAAADLPLALADLHRSLAVGAPLALSLFAGTGEAVTDDDLPGRRFTFWSPEALGDVVEGAGFADVELEPIPDPAPHAWPMLRLTAVRARTLADTVAPGMRLLVCGINPSLHAADAGVGYAGPGNRFWPALAAAGLVPPGAERDPWRLLRQGGIGMTDVVKRATPRASDLSADELRTGVARLERLCALVRPAAVVLVGLVGWRSVVRRAVAGWQDRRLGGAPVYVMPSTSGLNAGTSLAALTDHLRAAASGPPPADRWPAAAPG